MAGKNKPGPEPMLDEVLSLKIRDLVLAGETYRAIQKTLGIVAATWDYWNWKNVNDFRENLVNWNHERMVKGAEAYSDRLMKYEDERSGGRLSTELIKTKQKEAEFLRESLGKKHYSKRSEHTGKDGAPLLPVPICGGTAK